LKTAQRQLKKSKKYLFKWRFNYRIENCPRTGFLANIPRKGDIISDNITGDFYVYTKIYTGILTNIIRGRALGSIIVVRDDLDTMHGLRDMMEGKPYSIYCNKELKYRYIPKKEMVVELL